MAAIPSYKMTKDDYVKYEDEGFCTVTISPEWMQKFRNLKLNRRNLGKSHSVFEKLFDDIEPTMDEYRRQQDCKYTVKSTIASFVKDQLNDSGK